MHEGLDGKEPKTIFTGDGLKMSMGVGAKCVDLERVQAHPTGLVHPGEPDANVKFLAAEALRGVGGVLLDLDGNRFCNELGRRDFVTGSTVPKSMELSRFTVLRFRWCG